MDEIMTEMLFMRMEYEATKARRDYDEKEAKRNAKMKKNQ